jgi:hypothetical protein
MLQLVSPSTQPHISIVNLLQGGKGLYVHSGSGSSVVLWEEHDQKLMHATEIHPDPTVHEAPAVSFADTVEIPRNYREWAMLLGKYRKGGFFLETRVLDEQLGIIFIRKFTEDLKDFLKS